MTSFFVKWELWQQMTFVLGCCIVIVFLLGLVKLWHNNRQVRKHEIIDEERRTRMAEMKHCGIRNFSSSGAPFGARAIEQGVEVEGIWIAGSKPADDGQMASTATLAVDDSNRATPDPANVYPCLEDIHDYGEGSSNSAFTSSPAPSPIPYADRAGERLKNNTIMDHGSRHRPSTMMSYSPHGSSPLGQPLLQGLERTFTLSPQQKARHRPPSRALSLDSSAGSTQNTSNMYGSCHVFANRSHRRLNSGFEVLPAGTFGVQYDVPGLIPQFRTEQESIELQTAPASTKVPNPKTSRMM